MAIDTVRPPPDLAELRYPGALATGARGPAVKRAQEYLALDGQRVTLDGVFGPATAAALARIQAAHHLPPTGALDEATWAALTARLSHALAPIAREGDLAGTIVAAARRWVGLRELPENRGPVVRAVLGGNEGPAWAWCAGYVSTVVREACAAWGQPAPDWLSVRVTEMARGAQKVDAFIAEREARAVVRAGDVFLVRRGARWGHTGVVAAVRDEGFSTIEGNTTAEGGREGDEVRERVRLWGGCDFARVG